MNPVYSAIRIKLAFDGSLFSGFQRQPGRRTVQGVLESRFSEALGVPVRVSGCGRTDIHVHGAAYVASLQPAKLGEPARWPAQAEWSRRIRRWTDPGLAILGTDLLAERFHARKDAIARRYTMRLSMAAIRAPWEQRYWTVTEPVSVQRLLPPLRDLVGTHEFGPFSTEDRGVRTIHSVRVAVSSRQPDRVWVEFEGDRFLRRQVRTMVGAAWQVAAGHMSKDTIPRALSGGGRTPRFVPVDPFGLALTGVRYHGDGWFAAADGPFPPWIDEEVVWLDS